MTFRGNVARATVMGGNATLTMRNVARGPISRGHATLCMKYMLNVALTLQDRADATLCLLEGGSDPPP